MYYECTRCGQVDRFGHLEPDEAYRPCPDCGERTRWALAFEGDQGVSF
jgi:predicted  nucleic acid-binding Zn-ribbon protein